MVENIESLLARALETLLGIAISTPSYNSACHIRRQLYAFRERQRQIGSSQYDCLSFIPKPNGELLIVKRSSIKQDKNIAAYESRQLEADDCPKKIIARGKHKPG